MLTTGIQTSTNPKAEGGLALDALPRAAWENNPERHCNPLSPHGVRAVSVRVSVY